MPQFGMAGETGKGPYRQQSANWKASLAVAAGDAIYHDTGDTNAAGAPYDKSATQGTFGAGTHSQAQVAFKAIFRGYSAARRTTLMTSDGSDLTDGPILAEGEFVKPCAALGTAAIVGAYVGPAQGSGGAQSLDPQIVEVVTSVSNAIGKLSRPAAVGALWLYFYTFPATMDGGVQAVA